MGNYNGLDGSPLRTEYDNIEKIGGTNDDAKDKTTKQMQMYYHKQEVKAFSDLIKKMHLVEFESIIDLGCSTGAWYKAFKSLGFKKIIGIDISKTRTELAKQRGYDEVHVCSGYNLPFKDHSQNCIIINDVLVHVLQDSDKLKIFNEVKRVLKPYGIVILNFANAPGFGVDHDVDMGTCERFNTLHTITNLISESGLELQYIEPSYYALPLKGASPYFVNISSKLLFPFIDSILKKSRRKYFAKVIYVGARYIHD